MNWTRQIRWLLAITVLGILAGAGAQSSEPRGGGPRCLETAEPRLVAAKLAALDPRFLALPPGMDLGYPPAPGERRSFSLPSGDVICIERASRTLDKSEIERALEVPDSSVKAAVLDFPRTAFPVGMLRFPWSGISPPARAEDSVLWRGSIEYEPGRTVALWARVRLRRDTECVRASRVLAKGEFVPASAFESVECDAAAFLAGALDAASATLKSAERGAVAARTIRKGEWMTAEMFLDEALVAARRPAVLEVYSGGARLRFPVTPEENGGAGATVWVRSTLTRTRLEARVAGLDRLVLTLPGSEGASSAAVVAPRKHGPMEVAP